MKLSERQAAALLALADSSEPLSGIAVANGMRVRGIEANQYGAHSSANGLVHKELAIKTFVEGGNGAVIGYELTDAGRAAAAGLRGAP